MYVHRWFKVVFRKSCEKGLFTKDYIHIITCTFKLYVITRFAFHYISNITLTAEKFFRSKLLLQCNEPFFFSTLYNLCDTPTFKAKPLSCYVLFDIDTHISKSRTVLKIQYVHTVVATAYPYHFFSSEMLVAARAD